MERLSEAPTFRRDGVTWRCWITEDQTYVWRSECGRFAAGKTGRAYWSRCDTRLVSKDFERLVDAMEGARKMGNRKDGNT